jgi:hypothetical protein
VWIRRKFQRSQQRETGGVRPLASHYRERRHESVYSHGGKESNSSSESNGDRCGADNVDGYWRSDDHRHPEKRFDSAEDGHTDNDYHCTGANDDGHHAYADQHRRQDADRHCHCANHDCHDLHESRPGGCGRRRCGRNEEEPGIL